MSNPQDNQRKPGSLDIDYRETNNITHVHAAIQREKMDPLSGSVPVPIWLMCIFILIFGWGAYYLGEFNGGYDGSQFSETAGTGSSKKGGASAGGPAVVETQVDRGRKIFMANCATCHQPTGLGQPNQYPPLAGSEFVNGTPKRLAMILLKGLQGPIKVEGHDFNGQMPVWASLGDKKIADVLTYIRQEWGNKGGPVTEKQIDNEKDEIRDHTDPWSAQDILNIPADAVLPGGEEAAPAPAPNAPAPAPAPGAAPQ
ncbi:MAG TPA: cytochrome c [Chthoniobacteraceae bacterium]|nr:cytochrome c [Chthoniobacteraceae bacterium]